MSRDNSILSDASDDEDDEDVEFSQDRNKGVTQLKFDLLKGTGGALQLLLWRLCTFYSAVNRNEFSAIN